jgi:MurNAc alpha-1-phosphate uridylyltransferase
MTAPEKAFVLAAGLGKRMRPLTDACPKPLLEVGGRTMLDRALDALVAAGVEEAVVNTHYLSDMINDSLKKRTTPRITVSHEPVLLDTGGGVRKALGFFGDAPFYVLNADNVWTDGPVPALTRLADAWDGTKMDALLLLREKTPALASERGDYYLEGDMGRPVLHGSEGRPVNAIFMGPRIVHPRLFDGETREIFSFLDLFNKAEAAGRLYALRHDAEWYHVGTPEAYKDTNRILSAAPDKKCAM